MKQINTIEGLENVKDYYFITTCGKVVSDRYGKLKYLKISSTKGGYEKVSLYTIDRKLRQIYVHRLVALAFIPNTENKPQVNHIDEIKTHNYVQNFSWMTRIENCNYGTRNSRQSELKKGKHHTEETKKKISESKKGNKNHMFGRKGDKNPNSKSREYYEKILFKDVVLREHVKDRIGILTIL